MKRLEYLSGFSIGHILSKILKETEEEFIAIEDYLHKNYNQLWSIFYLDEEFVKGLRLGLKIKDLPVLTDDIVEWFNRLIAIMGYAIVITQRAKAYT